MIKISVTTTVKEAFKYTYGSLYRFLKVSFLLVLLYAVYLYFTHFIYTDYMDMLFLGIYDFNTQDFKAVLQMALVNVAITTLFLYLMSSLFTRAYMEQKARMVLLGLKDIRYILNSLLILAVSLLFTLLIFAIVCGTAMASMIMLGYEETLKNMPIYCYHVGFMAFLALMMFFFIRYSMILPAVFSGDKVSLRKSWNMTRGNTIRLFVIILVAIVPATVLSASSLKIEGMLYSNVWLFIAYNCLYLMLTPVSAVAISRVYNILRQH